MNKWFLIIVIIFSVSVFELKADKVNKNEKVFKKIEFSSNYASSTAAGYYDYNNELWPDRILYPRDSLGNMMILTELYEYKAYEIDLKFNYNFDKNLSFFIATSYLNQSLGQKISLVDTTIRRNALDFNLLGEDYLNKRDNKSNSLFKYLYIGGKYQTLLDNALLLNFELGSIIPFNTYSSLFGDPNTEFMSSGAFQLTTGAEVGYKSKENSFLFGLKYNYRAEEFSDQLIFSGQILLQKIERTTFKVKLAYYYSIDEYKKIGEAKYEFYNFDPIYETPIDSYLLGDFGMDFRLNQNIEFLFSFYLKILGSNTLNTKTYSFGLRYRL